MNDKRLETSIKLTAEVSCAGWASKLGPKFLADVLKDLPANNHPDLLVGYNHADDAGVFRINDHLALVQTVDFFPPIVDDPYDFGRIAAANALSDVYAMGGKPLTALNIVAFPAGELPAEYLREILRGGADIVQKAGAVIVGGHSIKDKELKYGIAVTGVIHPDKIITNGGARPGDRLYLTKPLGTGLITTGIKRKQVDSELEALVTVQMASLNQKAAEVMTDVGAHAATDITGFGILGHAYEMAKASGVTILLIADLLPLMPHALELAEAGMIPGGANANREFMQGKVFISSNIKANMEKILYDPQTSGGLFIAIPDNKVDEFEAILASRQVFAQLVGEVEEAGDFSIVVE